MSLTKASSADSIHHQLCMLVAVWKASYFYISKETPECHYMESAQVKSSSELTGSLACWHFAATMSFCSLTMMLCHSATVNLWKLSESTSKEKLNFWDQLLAFLLRFRWQDQCHSHVCILDMKLVVRAPLVSLIQDFCSDKCHYCRVSDTSLVRQVIYRLCRVGKNLQTGQERGQSTCNIHPGDL